VSLHFVVVFIAGCDWRL